MKAIELSNVNFSYNDKNVLKDINLHIEKGEFTGIIGPNGAGKSTILRIMAGILKNFKGDVRVLNRDIKAIKQKELARVIGFVPQETHFQHNYSVEDIVTMGRYPYLQPFQRFGKDDIEAVEWAIEKSGLDEFRARPVKFISSGERQMVVICRALAQKPEILLLDEPTSHLDIKHQVRIMELLKDLNQNGMTIVVVNHDLNLSSQFCKKLILLHKGSIYKTGTPEMIIDKKIVMDVYGVETEIIIHPQRKTPQIFLK
uniref:ABC transporter ATP-binding protein n=1 Tax=candidate division WOR-3 bacterium TaxID=2052148 RepID=A0A7C6EHQ6_UNCW3